MAKTMVNLYLVQPYVGGYDAEDHIVLARSPEEARKVVGCEAVQDEIETTITVLFSFTPPDDLEIPKLVHTSYMSFD